MANIANAVSRLNIRVFSVAGNKMFAIIDSLGEGWPSRSMPTCFSAISTAPASALPLTWLALAGSA